MIFNIPVGGKRSVIVSVYGAPNENIKLTHANGTIFTTTTDANGYGGELEIPIGSYTVYGNVSKFSKTTPVNKYTKTVEAWPDTANIYYWYGLMPIGQFTSVKALPNTSPYTSNPTGVQMPDDQTSGTSIFLKSYGDYSRGGTAYLPKTAIRGKYLTLLCSGAFAHTSGKGYLALNLTESLSNGYAPVKIADIATGETEVTIDISSISGGSYYPAISMNTSSSGTGSKVSYLTVRALYSVGEVEDVTLKNVDTKISVGSTYRYGHADSWDLVSSLPYGLVNYVGEGTDDYNAMMIPLSGFSFSGKSVWLKLSMYVMTSNAENRTFRWAITTSRANESVYRGSGAVTDANQLAQGTFSTTYTGGGFSWQTFILECDSIPANTPLYLYMWRNNTTYGNIHVEKDITVTLTYAE